MDGSPLARRVLLVIAGLMGAAGVAALAGAAHGAGEMLQPAALLLLVHAAAILALGAIAGRSPLGLLAMAGMAAGSLLFAANMAVHTFHGTTLFPMAAPIGGTTVLLAWLVAAAAVSRVRE